MDTILSPPAGQLLDGRYLVESRLARGGMATVYLGTDTRLDRQVALKIAHPELAADEGFVRRFIGEARSAAKLSSPNVVAVYDQGSDGNLHYLAMEYVPGQTLRGLLNERGRLSPREALDIIEGVLSGLAVAHDRGIVHRDVKPENVLLTVSNVVKVADFGLARAVSGAEPSRVGMIIGTAAYLAPEQVSSSSSDERTDVYATGVMLFELLTGAQPHTGDTPLDVAYKHVSDVVPAPSSIVAGLPTALDALVALATSRDPDLRPADARYFLMAITEVRRGMPMIGPGARGQHAAPGSEYIAGPPNGFHPAGPGGAHAQPLAGGELGGWSAGVGAADGGSAGRGPVADGAALSGPAGGGLAGGGPAGGGLAGGGLAGGGLAGGGPAAGGPAGGGSAGGGPAGGGPTGGSTTGGGQLSGQSDRLALADMFADRPAAAWSASGPGSWPTQDHATTGATQHLSAPGSPAHSAPGADDQAADLVPAAVLPPDTYRAANHTLIVPTSGLAGGYPDEFDRPPGRVIRGYRRRREPGLLQRWLFSHRLGYLAAALAVVLVVVLAIWWVSGGQDTTVPRVGGMVAATARAELRNLGFHVRAGTSQHSNLPSGEVIRTIPATGSRAKSGSVVTIIESLGQVQITVPPITGMQQAAAEAALRQAGLQPGAIRQETSTTIPTGIVIRTNPVAGARWPKSDPVTITVSAGQPLPSFVGSTVTAAQQAASAGGYAIDPVQDKKGNLPQGTIVRQSPAAGSPISPGEVVTVNFSPGPPMVAVPNVQFMNENQAVAALTKAGFKVTVNRVGLGHRVVSFSPNGTAPAGSTITIDVGIL
jgi:serine/threonine-protein kinase